MRGNAISFTSIRSKPKCADTPTGMPRGEAHLRLYTQQGSDRKDEVNKLRNGDLEAFSRIFTYFHPRLVEFAFRYLRSIEEAEDIVQSVMMSLWSKRESLSTDIDLSPYLFAAVRNQCYKVFRREKVLSKTQPYIKLELEQYAEEGQMDSTGIIRSIALREAIEQLSDSNKRVLLLRWAEGMSGAGIAQVLNISVEAAWKRVRRAEKGLREALRLKGYSDL